MPLWAQLLDDLRERLDRGEFTDAFPTDVELTQHYDVSRHTVREAVRHLQNEGVVSRERGRGTFVTTPTIQQATGAIYSLFRSVETAGLEQRSSVIDLSECTAPEVAERLSLPALEPLIRLERLRFADGSVLAHDTAWLPATVARPLLGADFTHTALYDELQRVCGTRPTSGTEWISTQLPTPEERAHLGVSARQPVFRIERLSLAGSTPVEWRETIVRGDRYTFVAQWSPTGAYETELVRAQVATS